MYIWTISKNFFVMFLTEYLRMVYMNAVRKIYSKDRTSRPTVFCEKADLNISRNSQKNTCVGVFFFNKVFLRNF